VQNCFLGSISRAYYGRLKSKAITKTCINHQRANEWDKLSPLRFEGRDTFELDAVDLLGKSQRTETLIHVSGQWVATSNGQSFRVLAAQAILEQHGELRFAIWNVGITGLQSLDDVGQNTQRHVDILGLFEQSTLQSHGGVRHVRR
jgi:hypothetical protein